MDYSKKNYDELTREEERLEEKYKAIEDQCLKDRLSFEEFQKKAEKEATGLYLISKYKRRIMSPIVEYGKEWKGSYYTLEQFKTLAQDKVIVDEDGVGYYATETAKSNVPILPSDVLENIIRDDFTHVIWFGR